LFCYNEKVFAYLPDEPFLREAVERNFSVRQIFLGKVFIFRIYLFLGDNVKIGEAALGICFPLKTYSSHPMHPVPHLSFCL
jgi:hypothetical protein